MEKQHVQIQRERNDFSQLVVVLLCEETSLGPLFGQDYVEESSWKDATDFPG